MDVAARHTGRIDLLLTDVIMPRVLGPELAGRLTAVRPGLRLLFMSGYTAGGEGSRPRFRRVPNSSTSPSARRTWLPRFEPPSTLRGRPGRTDPTPNGDRRRIVMR